MKARALIGLGVLAGVVGGSLVNISRHRADYWHPILNGIAVRAGTAPIRNVRVLPLKGCGWAFGETVYATTAFGRTPASIEMCRTREGVRFDITTYESHWIRRRAA